MYHYTGCGLRNIWLKNGYEHWNTPYGKGVAIADLEGLHRAIGLALVQHKPRLSGAEVRFLRTELDFSQSDLAKVLGVGETSVRGWEKHRTRITMPAERLLRALYREHVSGDGTIREMVDAISRMNREAYKEKLEMEQTNSGWHEAIAA